MLTSQMSPSPVQETMAAATNGHSKPPNFFQISEVNQTNTLKQAASLPNSSSGFNQLIPRKADSHFLSIPTIVTSPSISTSTSDSFTFSVPHDSVKNQIPQAISAPVTPTNGGFAHSANPPRRGGKGNQNDIPTESKPKSNSNVAHIPCKFFKSGACTAGKNCTFSHDLNEHYVCRYYLRGNCKFGSKCALDHPPKVGESGDGKVGKNTKNGSSRQRSSVPEIRSPGIKPQGYGPGPNDFPQMNSSPSGSFTRIPVPISPTAEHPNNRQMSQLTASLNIQISSDDTQDSRMKNLSPTYGNHLTAPIQIHGHNGHRRSLPDIFPDHFGTSPFRHNNNNNNNKSVFLHSYGSDSGLTSPQSNAPLQSIPEIHDFQNRSDSYEENGVFEYEECLPSSLNELLTPAEFERRERRQSRQEDRRTLLHVPGNDPQNQFFNTSVDPSHVHQFAGGRSLPHGLSVGAASYLNHHSDGQYLSPSYAINPINFHSKNASFIQNVDEWNNSPNNNNNNSINNGNNHHHQNSYPQQLHQSIPHPAAFSNDSCHTPFNGAVAINIPGPHVPFPIAVDRNSPLLNGTDYNNRHYNSELEDDVPFFMDDDKNEQVPIETPKPSEQPQTQPSYSAITKNGLKDSGTAPGLSIDSRLPEQVF